MPLVSLEPLFGASAWRVRAAAPGLDRAAGPGHSGTEHGGDGEWTWTCSEPHLCPPAPSRRPVGPTVPGDPEGEKADPGLADTGPRAEGSGSLCPVKKTSSMVSRLPALLAWRH